MNYGSNDSSRGAARTAASGRHAATNRPAATRRASGDGEDTKGSLQPVGTLTQFSAPASGVSSARGRLRSASDGSRVLAGGERRITLYTTL